MRSLFRAVVRIRPTARVAIMAGSGLAITLFGVAIQVGPANLAAALAAFWNGTAGSPTAIGAILTAATPIFLTGLGAAIAFRSGVFDLGQDGQFVFGALTAGIVAAIMPGPAPVVIVITCVSAAAFGTAWSALVYFGGRALGVTIIIMSLLANYVAEGLAAWASAHPFRDPSGEGLAMTRQARAQLPAVLPGIALNLGVAALIAVVPFWWIWTHGRIGQRQRLLGLNRTFAEFAGTPVLRSEGLAVMTGGALCGFAGAIQVLGVSGRYIDGSVGGTQSAAWIGVTLAILVARGTWLLLLVSLLLASTQIGLLGMQQAVSVSNGMQTLIIGVVLCTVALMRRSIGSPAANEGIE
jgi:general nucleoside transport system permease protein